MNWTLTTKVILTGAVCVLLVVGWSETAVAQAFVEHLSPPVLRRGVSNRIEIHGADTQGAVGLWTSLPPNVVRAKPVSSPKGDVSPASAVLDVELTNEAPLGLYGLRLATHSGLSNVHIFLVDELPVTTAAPATEPLPLSLPACVTARCRPSVIDRYAITVEKGQRVAFEVIGNRFGKDYDPLVRVRDAKGKLVAECDNSVGLLFDCRFAHTFAEEGTHIIEVRDARYEGQPTWHYVLRIGDFPEARVAIPSSVNLLDSAVSHLKFPQIPDWTMSLSVPNGLSPSGYFYQEIRRSPGQVATWVPLWATDLAAQLEAEPNDTLVTASPVTVPATLHGVVDSSRDRDWFAFELTQGQKLNFQGATRLIGSAADLELVLYDADGREVRRVDDTDLEEGSFSFTAGKAGKHKLLVRDITHGGGPEYAYRIDVSAGVPQIQLLAEAADLTVPKGSYQPLPLKLIRTDYAGEIRLELKGAPTGITLESDIIPAGVNEFVAKVMAADSSAEGIATLQVIGTPVTPTEGMKPAVAKTKPLVDRQLKNVDLIIYALRDDQRLLPPSLTNQIALMVTPPAPFTVELPESVVKMTRYLTADFPIVTTRAGGLASPITFTVQGGQIGDEKQERNQVYARFEAATPERLATTGTFFNRILTNLNKHRVDLTATADVNGHRINLVRTFTLDIGSAFQPAFESAQPTIEPGGTLRMKVSANRVPAFDGPVSLEFTPQAGLRFPTTVQIPRGQPATEFDIQVDPNQNPGRYNLRVEAAGFVGKYEESFFVSNVFVEVKKPKP